MVLLFAATMFTSALVLFLLQPMFAKMLLPLWGGTPAVWNTCLMFYQLTLLLGYVYAHGATAWLGARRQALLHLVVLAAPLAVLPIGLRDWLPAPQQTAVGSLLLVLFACVGLPLVVVSANAPMLQKWFAESERAGARDPYFLYAASNLGSVVALVGYPLVIEPQLSLADQGWLWAVGYILLAFLVAACALTTRRTGVTQGAEKRAQELATHAEPSLKSSLMLRWMLLSLVPSSLLLGVTAHVTTDIAPVPLLWVLPLGLYLLSFVLTFASRQIIPHRAVVLLEPWAILVLAVASALNVSGRTLEFVGLHLSVFFIVAMVCHGELAASRPPATRLTGFYLALATGGFLGGAFNALLAPLLFSTHFEYALALVAACALRPWPQVPVVRRDLVLDLVLPTVLAVTLTVVSLLLAPALADPQLNETARLLKWAVYVMGAAVCYIFHARPLRFALAVLALLPVGVPRTGDETVLTVERSFFSVHSVVADRHTVRLLHGTTLHGAQNLAPQLRRDPLTYYHRGGPIGQLFGALRARLNQGHVAVCGLGTGTLAAYAQGDETWTFYEIDPAVISLANDQRYFTYLSDCRSRGGVRIELGDARLRLRDAADKSFNLLILDAFSSDAVPTHLLTREAMTLYFDKLAPHGVLVVNVSNRYLDLAPIVARIADDLRLEIRMQSNTPTKSEEVELKTASDWMILARDAADFGAMADDARWVRVPFDKTTPLWTDDFSNILSAVRR